LLVVAAGALALLASVLVEELFGVCAGGFTGALALSLCAPDGLFVVAAGAFALALLVSVLVDGAAGDCAGGVTGALALSLCVGVELLDAADAAFALLVSVVGVLLLPAVTGELLLEAEALWSEAELAAGAAAALADVSEEDEPMLPELAWLFVQESEIMLTELTCNEPSLERDP
jgi:hypothetical protein